MRAGRRVASPARVFAQLAAADGSPAPRRLMGRAVVLGGSMAGLLAARVLSDHAEEVLVVERDPATGYDPRPGVPQGTQVHALLPAGGRQLERWFPGFAAEALAAGAVVPDPADVEQYINGQLRPNAPELPGAGVALVTTRPFLEGRVRDRVARIPTISIAHGRATGLALTGDRVTGTHVVGPDGAARLEPADLVVDATGRSSRLGDWLAERGWPRPPMRRMPIALNYATALYRRDPRVSRVATVISQDRPGPGRVARIGGILAVEGDRWIVLVAGYADDRPGRDPVEFARRCRQDFPAVFGDIAEGAEMLGDVVTYHQADSRRRDFHRLARFPAGLVAAGDAVASFNPVYGQGMTSAALHASCLSAHLRAGPRLDEPAAGYFADVRVVVDAAWQISTTADLALPHVDGPYPRGYRLVAGLGDMVLAAAAGDAELNRRMSMVTTMMAHPSSLAHPSVVLRAVRGRLRDRVAAR